MTETNGIGFLKHPKYFEKSRPSYNEKNILEFLKNNSIRLEKKTVVEFGAGSGLFTEILNKHELDNLILVEPDVNGVELLKKKFSAAKIINKKLEELDLDEDIKKANFIFAMQSFHWFDVAVAAEKFKSILKNKDGTLVILGRFIDYNSSDAMKKYKDITRIGNGQYESNINAYSPENMYKIYGHPVSRVKIDEEIIPYTLDMLESEIQVRVDSCGLEHCDKERILKEKLDEINDFFKENNEGGVIYFTYETFGYVDKIFLGEKKLQALIDKQTKGLENKKALLSYIDKEKYETIKKYLNRCVEKILMDYYNKLKELYEKENNLCAKQFVYNLINISEAKIPDSQSYFFDDELKDLREIIKKYPTRISDSTFYDVLQNNSKTCWVVRISCFNNHYKTVMEKAKEFFKYNELYDDEKKRIKKEYLIDGLKNEPPKFTHSIDDIISLILKEKKKWSTIREFITWVEEYRFISIKNYFLKGLYKKTEEVIYEEKIGNETDSYMTDLLDIIENNITYNINNLYNKQIKNLVKSETGKGMKYMDLFKENDYTIRDISIQPDSSAKKNYSKYKKLCELIQKYFEKGDQALVNLFKREFKETEKPIRVNELLFEGDLKLIDLDLKKSNVELTHEALPYLCLAYDLNYGNLIDIKSKESTGNYKNNITKEQYDEISKRVQRKANLRKELVLGEYYEKDGNSYKPIGDIEDLMRKIGIKSQEINIDCLKSFNGSKYLTNIEKFYHFYLANIRDNNYSFSKDKREELLLVAGILGYEQLCNIRDRIGK